MRHAKNGERTFFLRGRAAAGTVCFFFKMQILLDMERKRKHPFWDTLFRFDMPEQEYELLETEHGQPNFVPHWDGTPHKKASTEEPISRSLEKNKKRIYDAYRGDVNTDVILRPFMLGGRIRALAAFMNGMADGEQINHFILKPAMRSGAARNAKEKIAEFALLYVFTMQEAELSQSFEDVFNAVSDGKTAVFFDGDDTAVIMDTRGFVSRDVGTPENETVILGPKEAFTENIRTNVTLLRRIIRTDDFVCEFRRSGGKNHTNLAIVYREGVANNGLVAEVKQRMASIDTLMVLSAGTAEQLTERRPFCPVPQALTTERPDRAAAHLMQGHVAVLVEGSPLALVMPATLFTLMSTSADAYHRQPIGTIVRVVRYIGAFLSIVMPGYFIALAMHHQGMLSGEVLATVVASRNMVFLPLPIEMIFLLLVFQLVREAGLAAPGPMGQSIGIIGGLILGQAAVTANIASTVVLIIVALTGIGNFTIPDYSLQLSVAYYRVVLVVMAWVGGLLGFSCTVLLTVAYLASLKSYGVPFLTPAAPKTNAEGPLMMRGRMKNSVRLTDSMNPARRGYR